jgi:hypothetical protein
MPHAHAEHRERPISSRREMAIACWRKVYAPAGPVDGVGGVEPCAYRLMPDTSPQVRDKLGGSTHSPDESPPGG